MISTRRRDGGLSPTLAVILLLVVTVLMTTLAATLVFDFAPGQSQEEVTGVEVTFSEDDYGGVLVRLVEDGTADRVWVNTSTEGYELEEPGAEHWVAPGEGRITIVTEADDFRAVAQSYEPRNVPDERLIANAGPPQQKSPGSSYTFDASGSEGNIDEYRWDFDGDGETDTRGEVVSQTFSDPGVYEVTLTVESDSGATHTNTTTVRNAHLVVAKDGSGDYESIQAAVNAASDGWAVYVADGRYEETVTVDDPDLLLFSDVSARIDGDNIETSAPGLDITAPRVTVRGLYVTGFDSGAGVRVADSDVRLTDLTVTHSGASETTGAVTVTRSADDLVIRNGRVTANTGCGVVIGDSDDSYGGPVETRLVNTLVHSGASYGVCAFSTSEDTTIDDSQLLYNSEGGLLLHGTRNVQLWETEIHRNGIGQSSDVGAIHASVTSDLQIRQSSISNNFKHGFTLRNVEHVSVRDSTFAENQGSAILMRGKTENRWLNWLADNGIIIHGVSDVQIKDTNISRNHQYGAYLNSTEDVRFENVSLLYNGNTSDTSTQGVYMRSKGSHTVENTSIVYSRLYGSGLEDVYVEDKHEDADLTENWWGQDTGPYASQYGGSVEVTPYCSVEDCSDQK